MNLHKKIFILVFLLVQSQTSLANVLGMDSQTFNPTTNGLDFVTVHSSATLEPGIVNVGFFLNYAVNSLPYVYGTDGVTRTRFSDRLFSYDLNFGVGLGKNWDVGFSFPYLMSQVVDDNSGFLGSYSKVGVTGQRINTKYRFINEETWGLAVVASVDQSLVKYNPYTGDDPGPTYNFEVATDVLLNNDLLLGFNVGHRWRNSGRSLASDYGISPLPDQWIYSLAASYLTQWDTKLIWELYGSYPDGKSSDAQTQNASDREKSSLETLVGMKYDWNTNLAIHFGGGTEIYHGTGTPAWRVYSGINYAFGPVWGQQKSPPPPQPYSDVTKIPAVQNFTLTFLRFKFDSTELDPSSYANLDVVVKMIRDTPNVQKIVVEGHTDSVGSDAYNQKLSQARANTVKDYLQSHMTDLNKVDFQAIGYGESRPIANNGNYQGRGKNRRVVIRVTRQIMVDDKPETDEISITF